MKKIIFYIPLIVFIVLFCCLKIILGDDSFFSPIILVWISLFFLSGFLLGKDKFWGGVLGMLPGIHFIYMGTSYTGQAVNERLIGIVIVIFYTVCSNCVYKKNKRKPNKA